MADRTDREKLHLFLDFLEVPFARREKLLARFGEPEVAELLAKRSAKLAPILGDKCGELAEAGGRFPEYLAALDARGIRTLVRSSPGYPSRLLNLAAPPFVLYCMGDASLLSGRCLSVVGRRACRPKSLEVTERFSETLARAGLTVVSGMADGCDAAAHRGALKAGGKTVAVLAGGFDFVYPQSNLGLFREICARGLAITENPPGHRPLRHDFLLRNRIVAGLSEGTLVTCAAERSGTLSTANEALNAGRELFAIPGDIDCEDYVGTNRLIREAQGALVTCPEDILDALGLAPVPVRGALPECSETESLILGVLKDGEVHINEIAAALDMPFAALAPLLAVLEIKGLAERLPGNTYRAKNIAKTDRR